MTVIVDRAERSHPVSGWVVRPVGPRVGTRGSGEGTDEAWRRLSGVPGARSPATGVLPERISNRARHGVLGSPLRHRRGIGAEQGATEPCCHRATVAVGAPSADPLLPQASRWSEPTPRRPRRVILGLAHPCTAFETSPSHRVGPRPEAASRHVCRNGTAKLPKRPSCPVVG